MALVGGVGAGGGAGGGVPSSAGWLVRFSSTGSRRWLKGSGWLVHREVAWIPGLNVYSSGGQFCGLFVFVKVILDTCWDLMGGDVSGILAQSSNVSGDL